MMFVHKEYPRMLHGAGGTYCLVNSDEERDAKLAKGWSMRPVMDAPPQEYAQVAEPDGGVVIEESPKKRGRKAKADA